jgi:glycosyltransferase involved in cell wall biosynthesis
VPVYRPAIHLVNPLTNAFGGSERRTLNYFTLLSPRGDVTLWALKDPHHVFSHLPFRRLDRAGSNLPQGGTLVLVGIYGIWTGAPWLGRVRPDRLIIVYNTPEFAKLHKLLDFVHRARLPQPELVFCSETFRASTRLPGFVDWGLYDFERFRATDRTTHSAGFIVGRLSRDTQDKHHPQDVRLYRHLAEQGMKIRLMGASVFRERLRDCAAIEFLDAGQIEASDFLRSLDAFVYRTHPTWCEAAGRVVVEAMACELPVVVGRAGGYSELIEHGVNGFLFDTHVEAAEYLETLRADPALARAIGRAARSTIVDRFGHDHRERVCAFFLKPPDNRNDGAVEAAGPMSASSGGMGH